MIGCRAKETADMRNEALTPENERVAQELDLFHRAELFKSQATLELLKAGHDRKQPVSLAETLTELSSPHGLSGPNREFFSHVAKLSGESFDPQRVIVPFQMFRDLTVASAAQAGYLVGTATQSPIDILRP